MSQEITQAKDMDKWEAIQPNNVYFEDTSGAQIQDGWLCALCFFLAAIPLLARNPCLFHFLMFFLIEVDV